ncbi:MULTISPECIES: dienelactone hydrolase family protein [unclassified Paenibacillus]|uniref:dienelactone hydrolase family protein n=1 Tax=unclassified Paenibacillus TaxID=185978 RepID=UPI0013E8FF31|nr:MULTISPECIES: dienelactone hydrolase family protein [unclassified Paenibacillus]KAF6582797.1 dienelactone hydrolase family protein [Paenibacillus sp. EKM211P]KAF6615408.1 dienelactone hydrolase family protein [Paenibacillus sp. EKM101P]KAF6619576.1 dienelactone hydrolase family protein [Paenibacillus sp. EKM102P]KAF6627550.1 dienelactone hydrolase family protein [Paenibacillus sp. EKM10P]KAF6643808.1 dienelactone hydrolase family protein [Paenibacillus sp. EKM11P]
MISIDKKSDTLIVVLHEIYGINQHIQNYCSLLSDENYDVICPNLIGKETPFNYSQEEAAYAHFIKNIGFERASYHIESLLLSIQARYKKVFIVGFSIGATIAWLCSKEKYVDGIVGYYGSRIRNYLEITPHCPTLLFFPQEEISFNVDELISALDNHNIRVHKFSGQHGFSDPYSPRYHVHSAQQSFIEMVEFFRKTDQ